MAGCWASFAGDCEGGASREHIVSRTLLGKTVRFKGFFNRSERVIAVGRDSFVSKCLCRKHNTALSDCDSEMKKYQEAIRWYASGRQPGDGPDLEKRINGFRLAKWFAKTACNIAVVSKKRLPIPFAKYAFAESDDPSIHFYFMAQPDDVLEVDRDPWEFHWLWDKDNPHRVAIVCYVLGFPFMLSSIDVRGAEAQVCEKLNIQTSNPQGIYEDRLNAINIGDGPSKRGAIIFDWSGSTVTYPAPPA